MTAPRDHLARYVTRGTFTPMQRYVSLRLIKLVVRATPPDSLQSFDYSRPMVDTSVRPGSGDRLTDAVLTARAELSKIARRIGEPALHRVLRVVVDRATFSTISVSEGRRRTSVMHDVLSALDAIASMYETPVDRPRRPATTTTTSTSRVTPPPGWRGSPSRPPRPTV